MTGWALFMLTPARAAIVVSILFTSVSGAMMAWLYFRRHGDERRAAREHDSDLLLSRQLLAVIEQPDLLAASRTLTFTNTEQLHRVFSHLLQLLRGEDGDRLLMLADTLGLPDAAIARLNDARSARRVDAMRVLEQFPVPRAVAALIDRMGHDSDEVVQLEAAAALARTGHLPRPLLVIDMLDLRHRSLNRLHEAIFRASAATYSDDLCELSQDASLDHVRPLLVEALGWSDNFAVLPILALHAANPDPEVRSAALKAARKLGHPGAAAWVLPLLVDPIDQVRVQAARTCGKLGLREAIPILSTLVENPSWWVRTRAAEALSYLRPAQPASLIATGLRS